MRTHTMGHFVGLKCEGASRPVGEQSGLHCAPTANGTLWKRTETKAPHEGGDWKTEPGMMLAGGG